MTSELLTVDEAAEVLRTTAKGVRQMLARVQKGAGLGSSGAIHALASERAGREALRVRLADTERATAFGVGVLCRLAFPGDES